MPNAIIRNLLTGETKQDKTFDNPAYENALKKTGYTDEEARAYWTPRQDPFSQESLSDYTSSQTPKVFIKDNNIVISAPKEVLETPFVSQLQDELKTLRGADLNNSEVKNAISRLNEEIQTNYSESLKKTIGWTQEEFEDYQRAVQATSSSNPMKSSDYLKWGPDGKPITDDKGKIIMKTPGEWIEYWKKTYTPDERTDLFLKSLQSTNPYERTMALIMAGPGSTKPVYGYSPDERLGEVFASIQSEMGKFPEGLVRLLGEDNNTKRVESLQKKLDISTESLRNLQNRVINEDQFNNKRKDILGKTWEQLSDDEKAFVLEVGVSEENKDIRDIDREFFKRINGDLLGEMSSDDEEISKKAISTILDNGSFDKYKEVRDNYDTWQQYANWAQEDDERIAKNAIWSGLAPYAGKIVGTIGRFLWEDAVVRGLTGGISLKSLSDPTLVTGEAARQAASRGFSMNRISEKLAGSYATGSGIVGWLGRKGISPASNTGKRIIEFAANLVGTIPEDILQTAVDNIVTYNEDENKNLLNPTQLAENFRNNLIIMSLFNAARVGINQIRLARMARQMGDAANWDIPLDADGVTADADDLARAVRQGQDIVVDENGVSIVDADGNRKDLVHITPEQGKMVQQSLFDYGETVETPRVRFDQEVPVDSDGNIDFEQFKSKYITGDEPSLQAARALTNYQNESPVSIEALNRFIREGGRAAIKGANPTIKSFDQDLSSAFTHKVVPNGVITYSGLTDKTLIDRFKNANIGDKINIDTYLSTSAKPNIAQLFAGEMPDKVVLRIYASGNTPVAYMPQDISPRGNSLMENELLYKDGQDATVVGKYNGDTLGNGYEGMTVLDVVLGEPGAATFFDGESGVAKAASSEPPRTTIEVETPDGPTRVETTDYRPRNLREALAIDPEPTPAGMKQWHLRALEAAMKDFDVYSKEFNDKFGDVRASDFDWVWYNTKKGLSPEKIIGTTDPVTGRVITQNMINAMKWWQEQPFTKDLRLASRGSLGLEGDFDVLGYLTHTTYDPTNISFEEALNGRGNLWRTATGTSVLGDDNTYKGFGGDLNSRYRTFASNMLWDAKAKGLATSKVIEEAQMEGVDLAPKEAAKVADGAEKIQEKVDNATSTKDLADGLASDGDTDFEEISKKTAEDAKKSGLGQSIHDNWGVVYPYQNTAKVIKQRRGFVNSFDTLSNFLRNTQTTDGSMYDNGAADMIYAYGNALDIISRYMDPNDASATNLRDAITEYYTKHGRPEKYAKIYADKAMARMGEAPGGLTKAKAVASLANSMKWEAWSRLRRWLVRADYSQFNSSTKKNIDQFLFNHMQMESIKNNPKISQKLTKALEAVTGLRYRALFYGNIKNALLQVSELNRYFSAFKWGDVARMAKRLATDENFRARVDTYVDVVAPKTSRLDADLYGKFADIADNMEVGQNGVKFKNLGKKAKDIADTIGLAPIEKAEAFKNRMMIAGLVQEADRLGLSGDEALRHIRKRFERVALAADEMGRIGLSANPLARTMLFLQNFQIRELGMHLYNILDETDMASSTPKKIVNAIKYLTKVFGAKLAITLVLARLGYSAAQTLGFDPFGVLDNYEKMDEDDMNWVDKQIAGGLLTPLFSGGMTSLIADMYFMAREAYENSKKETVSEEAEEKVDDTWGLAMPEGLFSWESMMEGAKNFLPGSTFANRIAQMNEMLGTGWATSSTGNKMYTAPDDMLNTILGYLFGRAATQNALQYNQTYGDSLLQTLERFSPFRNYQEFDPIDTENYSDWFKGDGNDLQQFNKGRYWFQNERDRIIDEYQAVLGKSYASDEEISEAQNSMNRKLDELYDKLERFVSAYEKKNGTISSTMVKQMLNILNTGRNVAGETAEQRETRQQEERAKALERYSQLGLPEVGTYTGPSANYPETETKYQGSPQYRAAVNGYYDAPTEAVSVLKLADEELAPLRKELQDQLSYAYSTEDWTTIETLQNEYLEKFDQVVAPIIAAYGNNILTSTDVANQLNDMLSTGTNKRSGNLIPSSTYAKNKRGRYQSMPYERVDVGKWAQQRYSGDMYQQPTITSWSTVEEDLAEIKKLANEGKARRARTRALELKARVDSQERSLSKKDYDWLMEFLNKGVNE